MWAPGHLLLLTPFATSNANANANATEDGRLFTFGCGDSGVLGHGDVQDSLAPREVVDLRGVPIRRAACGDHHMVAATGACCDLQLPPPSPHRARLTS